MITPAENETSNAIEILNRAFLLDFPNDAARRIETMSSAEAASALDDQPVYILQPIWEKLAPGVADSVLLHLDQSKAVQLLVSLDPSISVAILSRFSAEKQTTFLGAMEPAVAAEIKELLDYPADSAGRLMQTRMLAFNAKATVEDAIAQMRNQKLEAHSSFFLLDDEMRPQGEVDMQSLVLATPDQQLHALAKPIRAIASALDPRSEVMEKMQSLRLEFIPVVDGSDRLIGVIRDSSLLETLKESLSADMGTMVGVSKDERALSSAWFAVRKRQPWLQINLLTAFLAAAVVGMFEDTIAKYTALAILLPIAAGQSGNTGAQALAVTMRGLTLREITVRHWMRVMMKEMGAGVVNGLAIAITCGLGVFIWSRSTGLALIIAFMSFLGIATALSGMLE